MRKRASVAGWTTIINKRTEPWVCHTDVVAVDPVHQAA